jgi:crotonobetainyl-CoA:carnitine CoA-transferase CaiB-like acyl-CoA transferase
MGDPARQLFHFFSSINGNKKSMTLDLKSSVAREILYRLIGISDVFMEGFRPGVAHRLGIDYETLRNINPALIYCSISGYGQDGPYRDLPGHDLNYLAMAGMMSSFQDDQGNYVQPGIAIGDLSSGMFAAIGILAALQARHKTGGGQFIDVSMFDGLISWMSARLGTYWGTGTDRKLDAGYGVFRTKDNRFFSLGIAHEDWFWERLCDVIGLPEYRGIKGADRRARRSELMKELQKVFLEKTWEDWFLSLKSVDIPFTPVKTQDEIADDPHVLFRKMLHETQLHTGEKIKQVSFPVKLSSLPAGATRRPPPILGEHTDAILRLLDYPNEQIIKFKKARII